ncbi:MAG TPA: 50S ribosomal protein L4 [bacterium]|jgi:large subunit ribosomal protein L4|nr:50S ribosomal protein L4 [bacterium]HNZ51249.1 50S ribosomal protein L4 [bacterium]HOF79732.1 50S ribosomal protein L4 [bacterium]HOH85144.1 50S ribosomal protein L4 [bacterium]HOQ91560.1 50S ribosomal protein L4 [bacterium]
MIKYQVYNQQAEVVGDQELSQEVFGVAINPALVHQAMVAQLANTRSVIADTKDRSEVRGGGKKPWKQKGTGRARAGSNRSPIWIGGGVTFGPTNDRNFTKKINKKMLSKAICMVFSDRVASHDLIIVDDLTVKDGKTKELKAIIEKLLAADQQGSQVAKPRTLILTGSSIDSVKLAGRNLPRVQILNDQNINVVSLLRANKFIISQQAIASLQQRYGTVAAK